MVAVHDEKRRSPPQHGNKLIIGSPINGNYDGRRGNAADRVRSDPSLLAILKVVG